MYLNNFLLFICCVLSISESKDNPLVRILSVIVGLAIFILFICLCAEAFHIVIRAFKYKIGAGILCLIMPYYSPYFAFKHHKTIFKGKKFTIAGALFLILMHTLGILEFYGVIK